jgi:hypothetical protein
MIRGRPNFRVAIANNRLLTLADGTSGAPRSVCKLGVPVLVTEATAERYEGAEGGTFVALTRT